MRIHPTPTDRFPTPRRKPLRLIVDGREIVAYEGETVAAVLLATGQREFRRTRVSADPRGLFCGMGVCYECRVTVNGQPNVRACVTPVEPDMQVELGGPGSEVRDQRSEVRGQRPEIRDRRPGVGGQKSWREIELAVVGAGPAGLEAALAAAEAGAQVALIDSQPRPGGQYFKQTAVTSTDRLSSRQREAGALFARLRASSVVRFTETLVWGIFPEDDGWLLALHGTDSPARLHCRRLILAPGAYDRPIAFPGWTLPGVITAGAAQIMIKTQGVLPGRRFLFAGSGPLLWTAAAEAVRAGAEVTAVLEGASLASLLKARALPQLRGQRTRLEEGWAAWRTLQGADVPIRFGWAMTKGWGQDQLEAVDISPLDGRWFPIPGVSERIEADTLALGYGLIPATQLTRLLGCQHIWRPRLGGWIPLRDDVMQTTLPGVYAVGDGAGVGGAALARLEGRLAGLHVAQQLGRFSFAKSHRDVRRLRAAILRERRFAGLLGELFTPGPGLDSLVDETTMICRCEEVHLHEIRRAQDAGCSSLREIKGVTRVGMGDCQSRICGDLLARALASAWRRSPDYEAHLQDLGMLSVRPPIHPLTLAELAQGAT